MWKKLIGPIKNVLDCRFMFAIHPGGESPNNRTKRDLREHLVHRKIVGTL